MADLGLGSIDDHASWLGLGASWRNVAQHARTPLYVAKHAWPQKAREHGAIVELLASKGGHDGTELVRGRLHPAPKASALPAAYIPTTALPYRPFDSLPPPPKSTALRTQSRPSLLVRPTRPATAQTSCGSARGRSARGASARSDNSAIDVSDGLSALLAPREELQVAAERETRAAKVASARLAALEKRLALDLLAPLHLSLDALERINPRRAVEGHESITGDATEWTPRSRSLR